MAIPYQAGETIRLEAAITDSAGEPVGPTTVKIAINKPDGTEGVVSSGMTNPDTGSYYYDYLIPDDLGTYNWHVIATGSTGRITICKDMFSVNTEI